MPFTVKYQGLEVVCETPQDIDVLAEHLRRKAPAAPDRDEHRAGPESPVTVSTTTVQRRAAARANLSDAVSALRPDQRDLLRLMAKSDSRVSDSALKSTLGLAGNKSLAGLFQGISKRMNSARGPSRIIEKQMVRNGSGQRHYEYWINPSLLQHLKEVLGISSEDTDEEGQQPLLQ